MTEAACPIPGLGEPPERPVWRWLEVLFIVGLFAVYAGQAPPAVNEAHYLTKARHAWNPAWCERDLFLASRDAHFVFTHLFGWLTVACSLPTAAWITRILAWFSLALGWQRLSYSVVARRGLSVLTAALWLALIDWGAMAGEWVVGGVEAKCFAYGAVCLGLADFQRNRWNRGWIWLGAATSLHVLVGGWALVAGVAAWIACGPFRPSLRSQIPSLVLAVLCALPGLVPALALTVGTAPNVVAEAEWIYVYGRLSHHLVFHRLEWPHIARHVVWIAVWIAMGAATPCRMRPGKLDQRPLRGFVGGAIALAVCGALIDQLLLGNWELSASLLRYYWFRMSDAWVPAGVALGAISAVVRWHASRKSLSRGIIVVAALASLANLVLGAREHGVLAPRGLDPQWRPLVRYRELPEADLPRLAREWESVCEWIRTNTDEQSLWLTPRNQQSFKWLAQRAEVVNVKDIPQDAVSVVEWQMRRESIYPPATSLQGLAWHGSARLAELAQTYGADYILVDEWEQSPIEERAASAQRSYLLNLPVVYPPIGQPAWFRIYAVSDSAVRQTNARPPAMPLASPTASPTTTPAGKSE